jgi:hypothetical protein
MPLIHKKAIAAIATTFFYACSYFTHLPSFATGEELRQND